MDLKDWVSFVIGIVIMALGILPLLEQYAGLKTNMSEFLAQGWFVSALPYIVAIGGFYLLMESIREITNSSSVGWMSFWIGAAVMAVGVLVVLGQFGIVGGAFAMPFLAGPGGAAIYKIIFIIEGFFLMIATFAMEI